MSAWAAVKAVNGWTAHASRRGAGSGRIGAQVLVRRPRPMPWGFAYAPRGPVAGGWTAETIGALHGRASGATCRGSAGRVSHVRIDPEIEARRPARPRRRAPRRALRAGRLAPGRPDPARTRRGSSTCAPDEDGPAGPTCARSGASTSTRRGRRASRSSTPTATGSASSTGSTARPRTGPGFLDPDRSRRTATSGTPSAQPATPGCCSPRRRRRAAGDAVPRPLRATRRRAVRRDDRGRRASRGRTTCSSGRRSGPRARRAPRATTCGASRPAGSPTSRPGSVAARSATSAPGTSSSSPLGRRAYEAAQRGRVVDGARRRGAASPPGRARRAYGAGRLNVRDATPEELADWDARAVDAPGGHVYQSRAWAEHRAATGWTAAVPRRRRRRPALALTRRGRLIGGRQRLHAARAGRRWATTRRRSRRAADRRSPMRWRGEGDRRRRRATPRCPAVGPAFRAAIEAAGFPPIEEIQPSRHRISLPLGPAPDEDDRLRGDREVDPPADPRRPRRADVAVVRHDARAGARGRATGFAAPAEPRRGRARPLLRPARSRPASGASSRSGRARAFVAWWRARPRRRPPRLPRGAAGDAAGRPLGRPDPVPPRRPPLDGPLRRPCRGAGRRTRARCTSCAGGRSSSRSARGATEMDLGGVDVGRRPPRAGRGRPDVRPVPAQDARSAGSGSS